MSPRRQERLFAKKYAKTLLNIAKGDYKTALVLLDADNYRIENAFYMAQQAIEKSLKAVLVHKEIPVPMIHDLSALLSKLPSECEPPYGYELNELNEYAAAKRYEEGKWEPTKEELKQILEKTNNMIVWSESEIEDS